MNADVLSIQCFGHCCIPAAFVDAVFLIEVHGLDVQRATKIQQHFRRFIPARGLADQQRNVQLAQRVLQFVEVAHPEVDFARGVVVVQPLLRTQQIHRHTRANRCGGREGGVVVYAQITAQPDQLHVDAHIKQARTEPGSAEPTMGLRPGTDQQFLKF
ncbi:hypothetical protein D3C87_1480330 [compost metagenome]